MVNKHIAASGAKAGQWVACQAQQNCTLTSIKSHTTSEELVQVQQYVKDTLGVKFDPNILPFEKVLEYKTLSAAKKKEIAEKVEAAKAPKKQPGTVLRDNREKAFKQFEKDGNKEKFYRAYLADYPNLSKASYATLERVFNQVESETFTKAVGFSAVDKNGYKINLTKAAKIYSQEDRIAEYMNKSEDSKSFDSSPALLPKAPRPAYSNRPSAHPPVVSKPRMTFKVQYLTAGALVRKSLRDSLEQLKNRGCTVSYTESKGLMSSTFHNIKIDGPERVVNAWQDWVRRNG